jgi:hypothetical protein
MPRFLHSRIVPIILLLFLGTVEELASQSITLQGGNQTLGITTGLAGSEPVAVINTASSIDFTKANVIQKVTVQTSCLGQRFGLKVVVTSTTLGTPAAEVTLTNGMPATDLVTGVPKRPPGPNNGSCSLLYTASATFAQGNSAELGNDVHTVTYTILAQ